MNSRKGKAGPRGSASAGPLNQHQPQHQSFAGTGSRYAKQPNLRANNDKTTTSSPLIHGDENKGADPVPQSAVEGVYLNGRIMHTITSLLGSIVQVVLQAGQTYEGVLQTFSPEFEIAIAAATEIDKRSVSEGNNIGHLISSLMNKQEMYPVRLFPIREVVMISVLNTDMDFASSGSFQTDAEVTAAKGRADSSEERTLVPWSSDDGPDGVRKPGRTLDLDGDNSNGWTAEAMFAANTELGVQTGFQDLDGVYTIPLIKKDTPEAREKQKQAEAIAREIEGNQTSKRRAEQENSDDRTEEEQFSAVTRNAETFRHPKAHPNLPGNRSDEMNWRQQSNRSQQNSHSKSAGYSGAGGKNSSPSNQQMSGGGRDARQAYASGPRDRRHQNQMSQHQQQQPHQTPPHHHSQPAVNQNAANHQTQRQQVPPAVPVPPVQSPKDEIPSKSIASSSPPTPPNYAKVVAEDGAMNRNAKIAGKKKEDVVQAEQAPAVKTAPTATTSSPVTEKKDPPVREKGSPAHTSVDKKETEAPTAGTATAAAVVSKPAVETESVENIAKNSKLNPNAKEFTLNPAAKPFTPRAQQPVQQPHQGTPPAQYQPQQTQVHQIPHHLHFQHQNAPQVVQMQSQAMSRMPNQQVLLHQMVGPAGNVFPYQVVMPQYQQQLQMNQQRPGKQNSKYQNPGNRNDQYNQNSPHNVAAATGHPVLATAPISYQQQPQLAAQLFQPMYPMTGFNPRMPVGMMGPQVPYDPSHMYLGAALPVSMVAPMSQQNNGHHSNPSTPQSQTPTTPGLHGPPTPGPTGHPHAGQTPTPQQTVMFTGQNLPPHSIAGGFNNQNMVLMGPSGHQQHQQSVQSHAGPHPGVGGQVGGGPHGMGTVIPVLQSSATPIVMQQHYQQNQPPPGR